MQILDACQHEKSRSRGDVGDRASGCYRVGDLRPSTSQASGIEGWHNFRFNGGDGARAGRSWECVSISDGRGKRARRGKKEELIMWAVAGGGSE